MNRIKGRKRDRKTETAWSLSQSRKALPSGLTSCDVGSSAIPTKAGYPRGCPAFVLNEKGEK